MAPRHREIDVDAHLNTPEIHETRERLRRIAEAHMDKTDSEIDERGFTDTEDFDEEDPEFTPMPPKARQNQIRPRGTLASQERDARIRKTQERLRERGLDGESLLRDKIRQQGGGEQVRQTFNPDLADDDDAEKLDTVGEVDPRQARINAVRNPGNKLISNRGAGDQVKSPASRSETERLKQQLTEQAEQIKQMQEAIGKLPKPPSRLAARRAKYESDYVQIGLPSQFKIYSFEPEEFLVKKIDIPAQIAITSARRLRDMSGYIDALGSTVIEGMDIRDISYPDWLYFLYHQKFTSYPKTPLILTWTSRYGNENKYKIQDTDITTVHPEIDRETFEEKYFSKGLRFPTLRDWELLNTVNDFTQEDRDIYARAQYFQGDTVEQKVDHMFSRGRDLELLELVAQMVIDCNHGVMETVEVRDQHFEPVKYIKARLDHIENLRREQGSYEEVPAVKAAIEQEIASVLEEVDEMQATLDNGGPVLAEVETQPVRFNALDIFPAI